MTMDVLAYFGLAVFACISGTILRDALRSLGFSVRTAFYTGVTVGVVIYGCTVLAYGTWRRS